MKTSDYINSLADLNEFTNYILNPTNQDNIVAIHEDFFETDYFIITIHNSIIKEVKTRLHDILEGKSNFVDKSTFKINPVKTTTVENIKVNFY